MTRTKELEIDYSSIKKYLAQRATLLEAVYNKEVELFVSSQATNSQIQAA